MVFKSHDSISNQYSLQVDIFLSIEILLSVALNIIMPQDQVSQVRDILSCIAFTCNLNKASLTKKGSVDIYGALTKRKL